MLTEEQVARYSRQILLPAAGGKGQERLLSALAMARGCGSAQAVGLAYLAAGGTAIAVEDRPVEEGEVGFLVGARDVGRPLGEVLGTALLDSNPDAVGGLSAAGDEPPPYFSELPCSFAGEGPWVGLGWLRAEGAVLYRSAQGCPACFELTATEISRAPSAVLAEGPLSVLLGALGALVFQRLVLGIGDSLGALKVSADAGVAPLPIVRCGDHALSPLALASVLEHLKAAYPCEGCGVIIEGKGGAVRVRPMRNASGPQASRTSYAFDDGEWLGVLRETEAQGERIAYVFHSHCDLGADLSPVDIARAAPSGQPLLPGVGYLVVAIDQGEPTAAKLFRWLRPQGRFGRICQALKVRL